MIKIDGDTIDLFKGSVNEDNCICFYGVSDFTWSILYKKDSSLLKSFNYYSIINPNDSTLITKIYTFNLISDAIIFYETKSNEFFKNSLIVIVDEGSKGNVSDLLKSRFDNFKSNSPKFFFFHRAEKPDLYLFYLELLGLKINYKITYLSSKLYLNIQYNSLNLSLLFRELNKLRFFLGVNDKTFKIKNVVIKDSLINQTIYW